MAPTTADIIASARYLDDDFDPSSLTIPNLNGILSHHGVPFASNARKPALVKLFEDEIVGNLAQLRRERNIIDGSIASGRGITDGLTGLQVGVPDPVNDTRRSPRTRRSPKQGSAEPSSSAPARRARTASAEPSSAATTSRTTRAARAPPPSNIVEESEPEDESKAENVQNRTRRARKDKGSSSRQPRVSTGEDSGWEDNNVFQSGPDDTPPTRNTRVRVPVEQTSPTMPAQQRRRRPPSPSPSPSPSPEPQTMDDGTKEEDSNSAALDEEDEETREDQDSLRLSRLQPIQLAVSPQSNSSRALSLIFRVAVLVAFALCASSTLHYKTTSSGIGYCDGGSNSNEHLRNLREKRRFVKECNARLAEGGPAEQASRLVDGVRCPLPDFFPPPDTCTPCPARATCHHHQVKCNDALIPLSHPLADVSGISSFLNGLPTIGPVAFPITCVEDRARLQKIGHVGKAIEDWLAKAKGDQMCLTGGRKRAESDAEAWGVLLKDVKATASRSPKLRRSIPPGQFDQIFAEALSELSRNSLIIIEKDASGVERVAAMRSEMSLLCHLSVTAKDTWRAGQKYIYGLILLALAGAYTRTHIAANRVETHRIASLVQTALDTLRAREMQHHTDPVRAPQPYLSPMHLRDLILRDEHSPRVRKRVWDKVESIVEGNANVRANVEELNGDETRVWRWVGTVGDVPISPTRRVRWPSGSLEQ